MEPINKFQIAPYYMVHGCQSCRTQLGPCRIKECHREGREEGKWRGERQTTATQTANLHCPYRYIIHADHPYHHSSVGVLRDCAREKRKETRGFLQGRGKKMGVSVCVLERYGKCFTVVLRPYLDWRKLISKKNFYIYGCLEQRKMLVNQKLFFGWP